MDTNGHKNDKTVITTKYTKHTKYGNSVTPSHEKMIFVSIRVHSWFKIVFRVFRAFRGSKLFFVFFRAFRGSKLFFTAVP